jgi:glycosyltransferase involved in cell wall biosynthesis
MKNEIYIFNLEMDPRSVLLSNNYYWAKEFKKYFHKVNVITTRKSNIHESENFKVTALHSTDKSKLKALLILISVTIEIIKKRKQSNIVVFHHMSVYSAVISGLPLKIFGIKQGMWFAHSKKTINLWIANKNVNNVFTASLKSYPFPGTKVRVIGHGIKFSKITFDTEKHKRLNKIICIGRISPIKNIENLIELIAKLETKKRDRIEIELYGPILNNLYLKRLKSLAEQRKVVLNINPPLSHPQVLKQYRKFKYAYNGMMNSVDKSALEATAEGCLLISPFAEAIELSGMSLVYGKWKNDIEKQIMICTGLTKDRDFKIRRDISKYSRSRNVYTRTVKYISTELIKK